MKRLFFLIFFLVGSALSSFGVYIYAWGDASATAIIQSRINWNASLGQYTGWSAGSSSGISVSLFGDQKRFMYNGYYEADFYRFVVTSGGVVSYPSNSLNPDLPAVTNAPLNPTNLYFNLSGIYSNDYAFPVDLYYEFIDANGNVLGSAFIGAVSPFGQLAFNNEFHCSSTGFFDANGSPIMPVDYQVRVMTQTGWKATHPDLSSLIDSDGDGFIDSSSNGDFSFSDPSGVYASKYPIAQARTNAIQRAYLGSPDRTVTNQTVVSHTSSPYTPAINQLSGMSSNAQAVAVGSSIASGLPGSSGAGTDMSGTIAAVGKVETAVKDADESNKSGLAGVSNGLGRIESLLSASNGMPSQANSGSEISSDTGKFNSMRSMFDSSGLVVNDLQSFISSKSYSFSSESSFSLPFNNASASVSVSYPAVSAFRAVLVWLFSFMTASKLLKMLQRSFVGLGR